MKKKIIFLTAVLLVGALLFFWKGKAQIINGRTMVPIRAIFEKMGAVVERNWEKKERIPPEPPHRV